MDTSDALSDQGILEIGRLRCQNADLQGRLDHSIAKIMSLQGNTEEITGGEVKKRIQGLYSAIQAWVAAIELDLTRHSQDFQEVFERIVFQEKQDMMLLHLGLRKEVYDGTGRSTWDRETGKLRWLGSLDTCINVFLSRYIWCSLYQEIFMTCYPLGFEADAVSGFDYMVEAIKGDRDGNTNRESFPRANKWRAEAMHTLTSTQKFKSDKESQMAALGRRLRRQLSQIPINLRAEIVDKHFQDLEINVLRPAATLKEAMACSQAEYDFNESEVLPRQTLLADGRVPGCIFKDIVKWRDIEPSEVSGGIFCCLFPGVYQAGLAPDNDLLLVESVVLVFDKIADLEIHALSQTRDGKHSKSQRSPTRPEKSHPLSPSPNHSRSSTSKSLEAPQHALSTARRDTTRSEPSALGRFGQFLRGATKSSTLDEGRLSPEGRVPPSRRGSEDRRETKDKAKRYRRAETEPVNHSSAHRVPPSPRARAFRSDSNRDEGGKSAANDETTPTNTSVYLQDTVRQDSQYTRGTSQSEEGSHQGPISQGSYYTRGTSQSEAGSLQGPVSQGSYYTRGTIHSEESGDDSMKSDSNSQIDGDDDLRDIITVETEGKSMQTYGVSGG